MPDRRLLRLAIGIAMIVSVSRAVGDDGDRPGAADQAGIPVLSEQQQRAVGIAVAHPLAASPPDHMEALGLVLDPTQLISELGEEDSADAAERAASAELARLRGLFSGGANASLRALEAAQTEQAKARADAQSATARFNLHWGPVAALSPQARAQLLDAAASGHGLLVRADVPGLHSLGALPAKAMLDVDGVQVPGRVLGVLRQSTEVQGVGLLVEVTHAPVGLGAGARVPVDLVTPPRKGFLLPRDAVLYDENGPYVYKRMPGKAGVDKSRYTMVTVSLLQPSGGGWLVEGVDDDDEIVVSGAGVLWSMQDAGAHAVDDDD